MHERILTAGDVAEYCSVAKFTVLRWIRAGKLQAFTTPGGHNRIRLEEFRRFLEVYGWPVDAAFFEEQETLKSKA